MGPRRLALARACLIVMGASSLLWGLWARAASEVASLQSERQGGAYFLGVFFQGAQIGVISAEESLIGGGVCLSRETSLFMRNGPRVHETLAYDTVTYPLDGGGASLRFEVHAGGGVFKGTGEQADAALRLVIETGGGQASERLDAPPGPLVTAASLPWTLRARPAAVYQRFEPLSGALRPWRVAHADAGRWTLEDPDGARLILDLDSQGRPIREASPGGLVARAQGPREARWGHAAARAARGVDVMAATLIQGAGLSMTTPQLKAARRLRLRLRGAPLAAFDLEDQRQVWRGDVLEIRREGPRRGAPLPVASPLMGTLASTRFIQRDHPEIVATARAIVGDAADTLTASRRLAAWVHAHLKRAHVAGAPSALETLRAGEGDCNEHAVLFAALARAVGVPTRVVLGLVYQEGAWGYHAWNEVWVEGGFLSLDVTWDQHPTDVGHLKLLADGLARQGLLAGLWGALEIEALALD
ncbi:transglutaminase-like domain-containing protein [Myxococcota bacterium]|nr:transglutaminase-like domain-containing protein [Myxococcota bacterium]MBU1432901.1 transglutaminase-like domain-containing protein [Myxococcota bacterium]